jgi:hypothetical protein
MPEAKAIAISAGTKAALLAAKARGVKLGNLRLVGDGAVLLREYPAGEVGASPATAASAPAIRQFPLPCGKGEERGEWRGSDGAAAHPR